MNPPTAPSPKPVLTSPVRLMVRMAPASLSEVLPNRCAVPERIVSTMRFHRYRQKGKSGPRSGTHRTRPALSPAPQMLLIGGSGLALLGVALQQTLLKNRPFARSE
ncbi:hypothetical protein GCM10010103_34190 [Streptomyces paradoxus]